jgi:hypothetical protein
MTEMDADNRPEERVDMASANNEEKLSDGPLVVTHTAMNAAYDDGEAVPLGQSISWLVRYRAAWWVVCERGWLRITDELTAADLDRTAARLTEADAITARETAIRGALGLPLTQDGESRVRATATRPGSDPQATG